MQSYNKVYSDFINFYKEHQNDEDAKTIKVILDRHEVKEPIKVRVHKIDHVFVVIGLCPTCSYDVFVEQSFCPKCSQSLDWRKYERD